MVMDIIIEEVYKINKITICMNNSKIWWMLMMSMIWLMIFLISNYNMD